MRRATLVLLMGTVAAVMAVIVWRFSERSATDDAAPRRSDPTSSTDGSPAPKLAKCGPGCSRFAAPDPVGDVVTNSDGGVVVDPDHHNLDIRNVVVRHGPNRITIRMSFEELRVPPRGHTYGLFGRAYANRAAMPHGADGSPWEWEVDISSAHPHRHDGMFVSDAFYEEIDGCYVARSRSGEDPRVRISYQDAFVVASFPRRCFAERGYGVRPRWIRVSAAASDKDYADHWIKPVNVVRRPPRNEYLSPRVYSVDGVAD